MTARDSGRYYPLTDTVLEQNVKVDFAWGNMPMQPNDDREAQLDPFLDNHIVAAVKYEGFPEFITEYPYEDLIPNVEVPNLVGLSDPGAAQAALDDVGLVLGNTYPSESGATLQNNNKVKTQSVVAGHLVNLGSAVDIVVYNNPTAAVPNLSGLTPSAANAAITAAGFIVGSTSETVNNDGGATAQNHGQVATQSVAANTQLGLGSTISYTTYNYVNPTIPLPHLSAGMTQSQANAAIIAAGFVVGTVGTVDNSGGATAGNNGSYVPNSQNPDGYDPATYPEPRRATPGSAINYSVYSYVAPAVPVYNTGGYIYNTDFLTLSGSAGGGMAAGEWLRLTTAGDGYLTIGLQFITGSTGSIISNGNNLVNRKFYVQPIGTPYTGSSNIAPGSWKSVQLTIASSSIQSNEFGYYLELTSYNPVAWGSSGGFGGVTASADLHFAATTDLNALMFINP